MTAADEASARPAYERAGEADCDVCVAGGRTTQATGEMVAALARAGARISRSSG
jgi:hypothetical protein